MNGCHSCPKCGKRDLHRVITTYDYSTPDARGRRKCEATDRCHCTNCGHVWDHQRRTEVVDFSAAAGEYAWAWC